MMYQKMIFKKGFGEKEWKSVLSTLKGKDVEKTRKVIKMIKD